MDSRFYFFFLKKNVFPTYDIFKDYEVDKT